MEAKIISGIFFGRKLWSGPRPPPPNRPHYPKVIIIFFLTAPLIHVGITGVRVKGEVKEEEKENQKKGMQ